jgi:ABC-type Fe3+/spermidine/putrescine transport system ATPase subunit
MKPAVEIMGVSKRFGEAMALHHVDLTVHDEELLSLLGPSGCGKSTLLRIVAGFEAPTSGRIVINGEDVTLVPPHRRPTNIVFQRGALFSHMNVFDNIAYSLRLKRWDRPRIIARVDEMLALVRLDGYGERWSHELSGGQAQRVALARALAAEPRVLLLDEPFSALDQKLREQMQLELRQIQRKLAATFVFVTHDQAEALVMSDRIAVMDQGRIVQLGTPRDIYMRPATVFASNFIGQTNLLRGTYDRSADGGHVVATPGGLGLRGLSGSSILPGARAVLSVRPEAIRVHPRSSMPGEAIPAIVRETIYLGANVRVGAEIAGSQVVWADLRDAEAAGLEAGSEVGLAWMSQHAIILEDTK